MTTPAASTTSRRGRNAGPGDRMPIPTRQRRPGLAALALVLILGGAALSAYLVLHSAQKTSVVFATKTIKIGQKIQPGDVTEGQIAVTSDVFRPVEYSQVGQLTQQYATTTIPAGAVISQDMYGAQQQTDCAQAGFAVSEGNFPPGAIGPGDLVKIISVPKASNNNASAGAAKVVIDKAFVTGVKPSSVGQGGGLVLSVLVQTDDSGAKGTDLSLAQATAGSTVQVELLSKQTADSPFIKTCKP